MTTPTKLETTIQSLIDFLRFSYTLSILKKYIYLFAVFLLVSCSKESPENKDLKSPENSMQEAPFSLAIDTLNLLINQGDYRKALRKSRFTINRSITENGIQDSLTAVLYNLKSKIHWIQGDLDSSLATTKKVQSMINSPMESSLIQADALYNRAVVERLQGKFELAKMYLNKCFDIKSEIFGENHEDLAPIYDLKGVICAILRDIPCALNHYEQALKLAQKDSSSTDPIIGTILMHIGMAYRSNGNYLKSKEYLTQALDFQQKTLKVDHPHFATTYMNIGTTYSRLGAKLLSLKYYEKALPILLKAYGHEHPTLAINYANTGSRWAERGNFQKAHTYTNKSLDIFRKIYGENHYSVGKGYAKIAAIYYYQEDYDNNITYLEKALENYRITLPPNHYHVANIHLDLGTAHAAIENFEKSIFHLEQAKYIYKLIYNNDYPKIYQANNMLGYIWTAKKQPKKALKYYQESLDYFQQDKVNDLLTLSITNLSIAQAYLVDKKYDSVMKYIRTAGQAVHYDLNNPRAFSKAIQIRAIFNILETLQYYYNELHQIYPDQSYQDSLLIQYQHWFAFEDFLQKEYPETLIRGFTAQKSLPIYEKTIQLLLNQNTKKANKEIFELCERTKSRHLIERLQSTDSQNTFGLPDSLYIQSNEIDSKIAYFQQKTLQNSSFHNNVKDSVSEHHQKILFELKQQKDQILTEIKINHPTYYNLRYNPQVNTVKGVQDSLLGTSDEAFLEYLITDSTIFAILIKEGEFHIKTINRDFPLVEWIEAMRCGLFGSIVPELSCEEVNEKQAMTKYANAATKLYQKLFLPIADLLPGNAKLKIAPDGILGYIPFEALLVNAPKPEQGFSNFDYLLYHYVISYAYSATSQIAMQYPKRRKKAGTKVVAFAPSFDQTDPISDTLKLVEASMNIRNLRNWHHPLKFNLPEADFITKNFDGDLISGPNATKTAFLAQASNYDIIHLATHGKANDQFGEYAYLAFSPSPNSSIDDDWLFNYELYNLNLEAEMVVLSACETGIGKLQQGEGIISLARGFSFAGARSIITSLWNVDDLSTMRLMQEFYLNLKDGMAKDEALHQAKMAFISNAPSQTSSSPLFWAAFIPIGDMTPLTTSSPRYFFIWISVLILSGLGIAYILWRKKAKNNNIDLMNKNQDNSK